MAVPSTSDGLKRGRWSKPIVFVLATLGLLGLGCVVAGALALRSPRAQQAVIDGISESLEARIGVSIAAEGFDLSLLGGRLDVRGLEARAGEGRPFVRIERTRIHFRPASIVRGPIRLTLLELDQPAVDLDAPFPAMAEDEPQSEPLESLDLVVESLRVLDGKARGSAPSEKIGLLESWRLANVDAQGHFDGRLLTVAALTSDARIDRGEKSLIELRLEVVAGMELSGAADVERLLVTGEELSADASLRLGQSLQASSGTFRVETGLGVWLGAGPTGRVELEGQLDLAAWSGSIHLSAPSQPGKLLAGLDLVSPELYSALELEETVLDLRADFDLQEGEDDQRNLIGELRFVARREDLVVLEVDALPRLRVGAGTIGDLASELVAAAADVEVEVRAFSGAAGSRTLTADLASDDLLDVEQWQIERGTLSVEQPSLDRLLMLSSTLWPKLLEPSSIRDLPGLGSLSAVVEVGGQLSDPWIEARGRVRPGARGWVDLAAKGRPISGDWFVDAEGVEIELGDFTPAASGRLDFTGRLEDPMGAASMALELTARDIAMDSQILFTTVDLAVNGNAEDLDWTTTVKIVEGGELRGQGILRPARLSSYEGRPAEGTLVWETGDRRLPRVDSSFELSRGVLSASMTAPAGSAASVGSPGSASTAGSETAIGAQFQLPLGALDAFPEVLDLSALPIAKASGPISLSWRVPEADWSAFLESARAMPSESPSWLNRVGRIEGGSIGSLSFDPACPSCSTGSGAVRDLVVEFDGRRAQAVGELRFLLSEGRAVVEPWSMVGDGLELALAGEVDIASDWRPGDPVLDAVNTTRATVSGDLDSSWLESLPIGLLASDTIRVRAEIAGPLNSLTGSGSFAAPTLGLALDDYPGFSLMGPKAEFRIAEGSVEWSAECVGKAVAVGDVEFFSEGKTRLEDLLGAASGTLRIEASLPVVSSATLPFEISDGWLKVDRGRVSTAGGEGVVGFAVPLDGRGGAEAGLEWSLPVNDWAPLLARLGGGEDPEELVFASQGKMALPLEQPAAAIAEFGVTEARITVRGRETVIEPGLEVSVREGLARVLPFRLQTDDQEFQFEASARLNSAWKLAAAPPDLVESFELVGNGDVDSGLLNPFLVGGRAEGTLSVDLAIKGAPSAFGGHFRLDGPGASFLYRSPYLARFEDPSFEMSFQNAKVVLDRGSLGLNEGRLEVSGVLSDEGRTDLDLKLADSVFRLDHGLVATLGGDLRFQLDQDGAATVDGVLDVERGALTRSVQLDLDLLSQLLAPIDLTTTEDDPLDLIALNVEVRTREGVRVKNNLGDLLMRWEPLEVTGTLARPVIEGRLEVDSGGLLYAYGQTIRLDKATIEYSGQEGVEPRLDFEATTSLEDPTIGRLAGEDPFKAASQKGAQESAPATEGFTADLARYYGEQLAGRVGESVGVTVSLRPLLIFGEADPGARLTVSRDLSPNFALAASVDLRGAEDRTYLLEVHELRTVSRLVGQAFTDDSSAYGGALLQRQEWGGSRPVDDRDLSRISKIVAKPPKGASRRGLRSALGLKKGDLYDPKNRFVAEVELVDYLAHRGYPDARVSVHAVPEERRERRVRLEVELQPGPRVEFVFEGEKIAKPLKALIRSLYRPDFFEPESIEEMRAESVRALRSRGFLEPSIEIAVEPIEPVGQYTARDRRITIRTEGGTRISSDPPIFKGLSPEGVAVLNSAFANSVQRTELAVGLPSADRRLLSALAAVGYPKAQITSRYQSLGDRVLTVEVEPGVRQRIASVSIQGLSDGQAPQIQEDEIRARLAVAAGDPLRRSPLSRSAVDVERYLGSRGYLNANVRTLLDPDPDDSDSTRVRFVVQPGRLSKLEAVEFRGLRSTREQYARAVAGLETGEPLARDDLSRARTRLWKTGLLSGVGAEIVESDAGLDRVVFDLEERDRYRLTYGVRWDSEDGVGAVVDATDDNFLGRGWTLGLRALASKEEDSLRGLARVPRAFGGPGSLEFFAAARELVRVRPATIFSPQVDVPLNIIESTIQYSHPLTDRSTFRIYGRYTDEELKDPEPLFASRVKNPQLGFQYVYDSRSPEPLTERGAFASVDLSGSEDFLGGDLRFVRTFSQLSLFRPVGSLFGSRVSWSQSYRVGLAESFDQQLTRSVRFFAGGEYSVRGYETESLGEQTRFGSVTEAKGGSALLIVNQELRWRLFADYTLVLFADAGNVWPTLDDFGSNLFTSSGLGLRAATPVGLMRLDIARPLEGRPGIDPEYKLYFGLGTTF